jgi:hypothetical protein
MYKMLTQYNWRFFVCYDFFQRIKIFGIKTEFAKLPIHFDLNDFETWVSELESSEIRWLIGFSLILVDLVNTRFWLVLIQL